MDHTTNEIKRHLSTLKGMPGVIHSWKVEFGHDATDDPALWIWVTLTRNDVSFDD